MLDETRKILPAKYDKVFLTLYTSPKYKDIVLMPFLRSYLHNPNLQSSDVAISDPRLPSDNLDDKHPIVDVFITMPDGYLHIEMQFIVTRESMDRFYLYHTKAFGGQLKSGEYYKKIKKVISLIITTETAIIDDIDKWSADIAYASTSAKLGYYFHEFEVYDKVHDVVMTKKSYIHILELNKLPKESDGTVEWLWGSLFDAEKEDQFDMLATKHPEVADTVNVIKELSADQQFRTEAFLIEKAKLDWLSSIASAKDDGIEEGIGIGEQRGRMDGKKEMALEMLSEGVYPIESIARVAKVSADQVLAWKREAQK